ncbi:MAG: GTPase [Candidatus Hodarchaeota archaeon]
MLKTKLAKYKEQLEKQKKTKKGSSIGLSVKKDGDAQIILVGMTNSGRSSLLSILTEAKVKIADYPFTTKKPTLGILDYEGVKLQIVEVPALFQGINSSKTGPQILSVIRNADAILLVIDLTRDVLEQMKILLSELEESGIRINRKPPLVKIKKTGMGGIQILGLKFYDGQKEDLIDLLHENNIYNSVIRIEGETGLDEIREALDESIVYKPALIVANKGDGESSAENYNKLESMYKTRFKIVPVSAVKIIGFAGLKSNIFDILAIIRVYTKEIGGEVSDRPLILNKGMTVADVAKKLHKRFLERFKYAKIFGSSAKFDGERVGSDHVLKDKDIVQIFTD